MRKSQAFGRSTVAIPGDVDKRLTEGGVRQAFERLPVAEQRRRIQWIRKAGDDAARRARLHHLVETLKRETQYEKSRWTYSLGERRLPGVEVIRRRPVPLYRF